MGVFGIFCKQPKVTITITDAKTPFPTDKEALSLRIPMLQEGSNLSGLGPHEILAVFLNSFMTQRIISSFPAPANTMFRVLIIMTAFLRNRFKEIFTTKTDVNHDPERRLVMSVPNMTSGPIPLSGRVTPSKVLADLAKRIGESISFPSTICGPRRARFRKIRFFKPKHFRRAFPIKPRCHLPAEGRCQRLHFRIWMAIDAPIPIQKIAIVPRGHDFQDHYRTAAAQASSGQVWIDSHNK